MISGPSEFVNFLSIHSRSSLFVLISESLLDPSKKVRSGMNSCPVFSIVKLRMLKVPLLYTGKITMFLVATF